MTLSISDERDIPIAKEVIKAHEFSMNERFKCRSGDIECG